MRFYTTQHKFYCGIDLHARTMYLCILDQEGKILLHRDIKTDPDIFLKTIAPYREDIVVSVECIFTWYWLADLCSHEKKRIVSGLDFRLNLLNLAVQKYRLLFVAPARDVV
jgi:hypothetical protein